MAKDSKSIEVDEQYLNQLEQKAKAYDDLKLSKQEVQMIMTWANAYVTLVNKDCGKLCAKLRDIVGLEPAGTQQG